MSAGNAGGTGVVAIMSASIQARMLGTGMDGVPVGGLDQPAAIERLLQTYSTPVELIYEGESIIMSRAAAAHSP